MKALERIVAEKLLKIKAVKLQPGNPFTWASGWKSPIYCDNRKTLSYPALRTFLKIELARTIVENFGEVEAVAGVATGAIAQGALVADLLGFWLLATVGCSVLLAAVVGVQGAVGRARRRRRVRR